jgi:hypothetical protein
MTMKKKLIYMASAILMSTTLLASCGANNGDMPPETTTGDNRETGVDGTGDLPGTGRTDSANLITDTTKTGAQ